MPETTPAAENVTLTAAEWSILRRGSGEQVKEVIAAKVAAAKEEALRQVDEALRADGWDQFADEYVGRFRPGDQDTAGCAYFPSCGRNCDPPCSIRPANQPEENDQ